MAGLAPISFGMMGLSFALFLNAASLFGIDAKPAKEGAPDPARTIAIIGSLSGALTLFFMAAWFVIGAPLGTTGGVVSVQQLFSITPLMYALIWLGLAYVQWYGLDVRYIGNSAFVGMWYQLFMMGVYAYLVGWKFGANDVLIEITLLSYACALAGFWAVTHGKLGAKTQGAILAWAGIMTLYLMFFPGGILPAP
jgi:hypothetical protein